MIVRERLTPGLAAWLRRAHDDGEPELVVRPHAQGLTVSRPDGRPLSGRERLEVRALLAAHRADPLTG